jgi:hypothetical protein
MTNCEDQANSEGAKIANLSVNEVKSSFAMCSVCDRQSFASGPALSRTGHRLSREKCRRDAPRCLKSPFSAVRLVDRKPRKMGMIRELWGKWRRRFSAVQTAWRRECDSNSHYRFEFRNPRCLRNLQAVQHLTRESTGSD